MTRGHDDDRREVEPPKRRREVRRGGVTMGPRTNISVPISFGLPLIAVGLALLVAAVRTGALVFWITGVGGMALGVVLFASGKRL